MVTVLRRAITTAEKLRAVERELALRKSAYPKWVKRGRMSQEEAERELEVMAAVVEDYRREQAHGRRIVQG